MRRPTASPEVAALLGLHRRTERRTQRRTLLRGVGGAAVLTTLAACGTKGTQQTEESCVSTDSSTTDRTLQFSNWPQYLDVDGSKYPTLEAFQQKTGIKATYAEDIDDNDTYFGKIQAQLARGQDIGKDVIVFTDWMVARCIRRAGRQKLDPAAMPNAKNLIASQQNVDYDPGRSYSLPWQGVYGVLAWNKEKVPGGLKSVSDLWKPELKGRVEVLSRCATRSG